jgi:hypothetical protein
MCNQTKTSKAAHCCRESENKKNSLLALGWAIIFSLNLNEQVKCIRSKRSVEMHMVECVI